jgi:dCMP deaminase
MDTLERIGPIGEDMAFTLTAKIRKQREWDLYFLKMAELVASKSCDPSMKVGCVIVGKGNEIFSTGYNGFPRGVEPNNKRLERPTKYCFTEHGERNAVYNAARSGVSLVGCTAYIACLPRERGGRVPCNDCARALIQAGVACIIEWNTPDVEDKTAAGTWRETLRYSYEMLTEAGVRLRYINE